MTTNRMALQCAAFVLIITLSAVFASPALAEPPQQVLVSVKIIEFQTTKGVETGLSAYFTRLSQAAPFGQVTTNNSTITTADLTFPTSTAAGITVFLDRLSFGQGELEVVLQALVDENRAFILSKPFAMIMVGQDTPTVVQTTQQIPYESTVVVGSTAVQVTKFEDTGVTLNLTVPEVIDDDGDWTTTDDTYVRLKVDASVKEEGQRIVVALDDELAGGDFTDAENRITVPEFISRSVKTHVWVRDGQVLMLGGLYRNSESKNISTLPWLTQAEDAAVGFVENALSGNLPASPLSSTIGARSTTEGRRELVFLIKSEIWRPAFAISDRLGFESRDQAKTPPPPDVVTTIPNGPPEEEQP